MRAEKQIILWTGVVGVSLLPALSNVGYSPISLEYIFAALATLLIALACMCSPRAYYVNTFILLIFTTFSTSLYFGHFFLVSNWSLLAAIITALSFSVLAFRHFDKALMLAGIVAFSQIISAAVMTPSVTEHLKELPVQRSNVPSVIHLMLDEHAGMAAIPPEAVPQEQIQKFHDEYVKRGFIVFTHAYTMDKLTDLSLVRMLNISAPKPQEAIVAHNPVIISRSTTFDNIGTERAIDITNITEIDPTLALANNQALARQLVYNINNIESLINKLELTIYDRLIIATSLTLDWLNTGAQSPFVHWLSTSDMGESTIQKFKLKGNLFAIVARSVLHQITQRLSCCGKRGTYYFAHLLIPHRPFLFDKDCNLLPISQWRGGWTNETVHNKAEWLELYRLHFGQASCAALDVFNLLESIKKRPELSDAIILVHSDHGSRIILAHDNSTEHDWRGSFIAIKIPNIEGRVIDTPVRLDTFYSNLLENHFQKLDFEKLKPLEDSPY